MPRFFGRPTRGGMLSILNCVLWAAVALGLVTDVQLLLYPALLACWPAAWLFILPVLGNGSDSAEASSVVASVMIGLNSLLWGYGISWLLSLATRLIRRSGPDRPQRGFDVVLNPTGPEAAPAVRRDPPPRD